MWNTDQIKLLVEIIKDQPKDLIWKEVNRTPELMTIELSDIEQELTDNLIEYLSNKFSYWTTDNIALAATLVQQAIELYDGFDEVRYHVETRGLIQEGVTELKLIDDLTHYYTGGRNA